MSNYILYNNTINTDLVLMRGYGSLFLPQLSKKRNKKSVIHVNEKHSHNILFIYLYTFIWIGTIQ